jgi:hypothetical protein
VRDRARHLASSCEVHLVDPVADQRDRPDLARARMRLQVDRQHAQRGVHVRGRERRVGEVHQAAALDRLARDRDTRAHARVDQVAVREADVRLECRPTRARDAVAQRRHRGRHRCDHAHERAAGEVAQVARRNLGARVAAQEIRVVRAHEEVRPEAVVLDRERAAVLEPPVELHHGDPVAHAIGRLEQESGRHGGDLPGRGAPGGDSVTVSGLFTELARARVSRGSRPR